MERQLALVERPLDEIESAMVDHDRASVRARVLTVLAIDPKNADALAALASAERGTEAAKAAPLPASEVPASDTTEAPFPPDASPVPATAPSSFVNGRYRVRLLGEGGEAGLLMGIDHFSR